MLKGIETVVYFVEDMARASAWYRTVLGIEPNYDTEHYTGFTVAGDELGLHPGKPGAGGQTAYWSVDDMDKRGRSLRVARRRARAPDPGRRRRSK